jgi:hypothetical protein
MSAFRVVLSDVPRIGFNTHFCPFPGALYAWLQYTGDPHDYDELMGVTGAAFRRTWNRDDGGNVDLSYFGDEPFRRIFGALGYAWRNVPAEKEAMAAAFMEGLARGVPVISFGLVGPPEAGLVTGYDDASGTLWGWSYFQPDSATYYEKRDWFETMEHGSKGKGALVIGEKLATCPASREVVLSTLRWAVDLERTAHRPELPNHVSGLAACEAWANALQVDADYPAGDSATLATRVMVHGDQCMMLEERHDAARYLRRAAGIVAEAAEPLQAAARLYDEAASQGGALWPWGNDMGRVAQEGITQAEVRRSFVQPLRTAQAKETEAVAHLERALEILG